MPYDIRKLPDKEKWRVYNKNTGRIASKATTKDKAEAQRRLLYMIERKETKPKMKGGVLAETDAEGNPIYKNVVINKINTSYNLLRQNLIDLWNEGNVEAQQDRERINDSMGRLSTQMVRLEDRRDNMTDEEFDREARKIFEKLQSYVRETGRYENLPRPEEGDSDVEGFGIIIGRGGKDIVYKKKTFNGKPYLIIKDDYKGRGYGVLYDYEAGLEGELVVVGRWRGDKITELIEEESDVDYGDDEPIDFPELTREARDEPTRMLRLEREAKKKETKLQGKVKALSLAMKREAESRMKSLPAELQREVGSYVKSIPKSTLVEILQWLNETKTLTDELTYVGQNGYYVRSGELEDPRDEIHTLYFELDGLLTDLNKFWIDKRYGTDESWLTEPNPEGLDLETMTIEDFDCFRTDYLPYDERGEDDYVEEEMDYPILCDDWRTYEEGIRAVRNQKKKILNILKKYGYTPRRRKAKRGEGLSSACWKGYEAIGMKQKGKRMVPNCVPIEGEGLGQKWIYVPHPIKGKGNTASKARVAPEPEPLAPYEQEGLARMRAERREREIREMEEREAKRIADARAERLAKEAKAEEDKKKAKEEAIKKKRQEVLEKARAEKKRKATALKIARQDSSKSVSSGTSED